MVIVVLFTNLSLVEKSESSGAVVLCGLRLRAVYNPVRHLRSSGADLFSVRRIRPKCAEGAFSYCGPDLWNVQPCSLKALL